MKKYLTNEEIHFYQKQGALIIKNVFKPWINILREGFEKVINSKEYYSNSKIRDGFLRLGDANFGLGQFWP